MKFFTRQQMKELDRQSVEEYGIPALILMENAGRTVADEVLKIINIKSGRQRSLMKRQWNPDLIGTSLKFSTKTRKITVLCGPGNNGGDGLVAARHLFNQGVPVEVIYLGDITADFKKSDLTPAQTNLKIVKQMGIPLIGWGNGDVPGIIEKIKGSSVIIDAIFGIGLDRPVEGVFESLIEQVNELKIPVVAADVPSGLDADRGLPLGAAIRAAKTVTFAAPKTGFAVPSARQYTGEVIVADIGVPRALL